MILRRVGILLHINYFGKHLRTHVSFKFQLATVTCLRRSHPPLRLYSLISTNNLICQRVTSTAVFIYLSRTIRSS